MLANLRGNELSESRIRKLTRVVAFWLLTSLPIVVVVPMAGVSSTVVAQDERAIDEPTDESSSSVGGENLLMFFFRSLGITFSVVFLSLSFWLVSLLVMCFLQLRRSVLMPPGLAEQFSAHLDAKEWQEAFNLASEDGSYLGNVLAAGIGRMSAGYPQAVEAMHEAELDESVKLEHKISYVSLIGGLAPLFGLLGTVHGMVASFMVIAQSTTAPKPTDLAAGISTALVTTLVGLWLAIPAIAAFTLFKNWLQRLTVEVDAEAMRLMSRFGKKSQSTSTPTA